MSENRPPLPHQPLPLPLSLPLPLPAPRPGPLPLALPDGDLLYWPQLVSTGESAALLAALTDGVAWQRQSITLFGKTYRQPRLIGWMGDPGCTYRYSGTRWQPQPWHPLVADLRERIAAATGATFNSVLLNLYRDGRDSMGFHADDEPELGPEPVIASLSLGAERPLHFRPRRNREEPTRRFPLADGSLLLMRGATQAHWHHAIPKTRRPIGPRLNLTFRRILG